MSAPTPNFRVLASVPVYGSEARLYRLAHGGPNGLDFVLVEAEPGATDVKSIVGPYGLEQLLHHAAAVLAGEPRAMTRPDSQKMLALGLAAYDAMMRAPLPASVPGQSPASEGFPAREPSEPSPPDVLPGTVAERSQGGRAVHSFPGAQAEMFGRAPSNCTDCGG
ncbi:MAG: hypothetical protein AB1592_11410 [Pseudomonadota bacterium]